MINQNPNVNTTKGKQVINVSEKSIVKKQPDESKAEVGNSAFHAKAEGKNPSKNKDKKKIIEQENVENVDQQPISKETRKWLKQIIEFIDKHNPKQTNGIEENEQTNDENEFNEIKNELSEKLKKSDKEVVTTREDVKQFFALLNNFLKDIEMKMTKKLKKLEALNTFRIKKTIEKEIKTPKKQKEVAKLEKCICKNQKTNIEKDLLDKSAALEAIQLFKKLHILNCLATDEKQKEINEYFNTYYYEQKQKALKSEEQKLFNAINHSPDCPKPCFATKAVYKCLNESDESESEQKKKEDDYGCIDICCLPCTCAGVVAYCAIDISLTSVVFATSGLIDVGYCFGFCCGVKPYLVGSACVNEVKKGNNAKKQEKIEKHLKEITPP